MVTALAVLGTPALLLAHARLVKSTPADNARVTALPTALSLWFSEKPERRFTKIQLLDSGGNPVTLGAVASAAGDATGITIPIVGFLTDGRYTISWRTAGSDGHPTTGKLTFTIAVPAPTAQPVAAPPPAPPQIAVPNTVLETTDTTVFSTSARWVELVALLTLIGAAVFPLYILPGAAFSPTETAEATDRARRLGNAVLLLFALTMAWRLSGQAGLIPGSRSEAMLEVIRETQWGRAWLIGATGAVVVFLGLLISRSTFVGWVLAGIGVLAACLGEGLTGHAGALREHASLASAVDLTHLVAAGAWLGGLVAVLLCGLPATSRLDAAEQRRTGRQLVRAYHRTALLCVALVLITAGVAAWLRLASFDELWTTPYGSMLFRKTIFVLGVLAFGFYHWRYVVRPEWNDDTAFRFKRSATFELLAGAVVVAFTALLVATALPH
jgi:copper transport protein